MDALDDGSGELDEALMLTFDMIRLNEFCVVTMKAGMFEGFGFCSPETTTARKPETQQPQPETFSKVRTPVPIDFFSFNQFKPFVKWLTLANASPAFLAWQKCALRRTSGAEKVFQTLSI